jgi:trehalose 6-phosphate phosphatase
LADRELPLPFADPSPHFDSARDVAARVVRRIGSRHALLLTDFDGTLSALAPTPDEAYVSAPVREALEAVAVLDRVTVGVVSGRRRADVADRVGPSAEFVAGLHGLEIEGRSAAFRHDALLGVAPIIARLAVQSAVDLSWCPGCLIENKVYALTCHVRLVPDDLAESALEVFEDLAEPYLQAGTLRMLTGAKAMELLPAADWHKGRAVEWIRRHVADRTGERVGVIYLGDDRTDEDAFTALSDDDFSIGVGLRPHSHMIDARLSGPPTVGEFFGLVATLWRAS